MSSLKFARVDGQQGKCDKENLSRKTCQGKLASVYSRQVFLDKWTCQGKIARVNGALSGHRPPFGRPDEISPLFHIKRPPFGFSATDFLARILKLIMDP